jgi:hypothetical protein
MYPEFIRAEYLQKRKNRWQFFGRTAVVFFIAVLVMMFSGLLYLSWLA